MAQEVEAAAKQIGFNFSRVDAANDNNDVYSLRYAEFVVPLVKAVQERHVMIENLTKQVEAAAEMPVIADKQQKEIDELKQENETQKSFNSDLQKQINELKALIKNK